MITKEEIADAYKQIQDEICTALETADGKAHFEQEEWERDGGGGGRTRVIQNGNIFEKGGVNFSAVHGRLPETIKNSLRVEQDDFFATGVSIVIHPNHPLVPIIHINIRIKNQFVGLAGGLILPRIMFLKTMRGIFTPASNPFAMRTTKIFTIVLKPGPTTISLSNTATKHGASAEYFTTA